MSKIKIPVTIAVPAFNADAYIADAIRSLLDQTYTDFEMIISDNASEDHTGDICLHYAALDKRITYVRNPVNVGANRNFCNIFARTRGEFLLLASDHDLWRPDTLEHYLQEYKKEKDTVLVYSPATVIAATGEVLQVNRPDTRKNSGKFATFYDVFSGAISSTAICGLFLTDALQKTSIHTSLGPDTLLLAELSLYGQFRQIPRSHYFRRQNRPPESRQAAVTRYIEMLFENPHDIVRTMPYEHMLYKALCMVQNNYLTLQEQKILNVYILDVFTRSWGVSPKKFLSIILHMKDRKGPSPQEIGGEIQAGKRSLKPERMALDIDMFMKTIRDSAYADLSLSYEANTGQSAAFTNQISGAFKKWPTGKNYDVCYLLYNTSKWGGVKGTLVQVNGLVDRGYKVCLVSKSGPPTWFPLKGDFIHSPTLSAADIPASDIVIGTWYPTAQVAHAAQKGIAVHYCRGYEAQAPDLPDGIRRQIEAIYRLPTVKIANSPHIARLIKDEFGQRSYVVRNDINHDVFSARRDNRPRRPEDPWRVLIVGPYEIVWKGIKDCIAACRILLTKHGYQIEIERASQTAMTEEEAVIAKEFAGRYTYHCNLDEPAMADLYNTADLFLSGSHPRVESFGRPAMEALACGLPAVLTDIPAYRDYDPVHDYALFVEHGSGQALADAAAHIIMNNDLRMKLIARGLEVSTHYSNKQTMTDLEGTLKDIYASQSPAPAVSLPAFPSYYGFSRPEVQAMVSKSARTILDIGCATGRLGADLKRTLGAEVWGIEPAERVALEAQRSLDRVLISPAEEALKEVPDAYFDAIICADVLEHMEDPAAFLAQIRNKLTARGELIASIPNVRHWSVVQGLLEGRWDYEDAGILDRTHLRFFTRKSVIELFRRADLRISSLSATQIQGNMIPDGVVQALSAAGIDTSSLKEESYHYQYLVKAGARSIMKDQVSIVILTFNQLNYTKECVESIRKHTHHSHEIIFIDNGSTDGTVKWLRKLTQVNAHYRFIENGKNLGFAKGCNQGIEAANGEFILLLNNDVVVTENWLSGLLECLKQSPDAGIVGPMTNSISGIQKIAEVGYKNISQLADFAKTFRGLNRYRRIPQPRIVGFCMLFTRDLADKVGLLDESFGTGNFEDDDFCYRAALAGYQNVIAGDVFIHHYGSRSFIGNKINNNAVLSGNKQVFIKKWGGIDVTTDIGKKMIVKNAVEKARELYEKELLDKATETLVDAIKYAPDDEGIYFCLAEMFLEAHKYQDALDTVESMPESLQGTVIARTLIGYCKAGLGLHSQALEYADHALAEREDHPQALNLKGLIAFKSGDRVSAEFFFKKAMETDPGYGEPYTNMGVILWQAGQKNDALELFEKGFILSPSVPDVLSLYQTAVSDLNLFARAEEVLAAAVNLHPLLKKLSFTFISVLLAQEKHAEAMQEIERAMLAFGVDDGILGAALAVRDKVGPMRIGKSAPKKGALSVCMIVKNEEEHMARCLMSLKPVADELIVVDTGSTDRTRDLALAFGAQIHQFPWTGDFSAARNYSVSKACGNWILIHDADEVISSLDYDNLRKLIKQKQSQPTAYSFITRNYTTNTTLGGWTANLGEYPAEESGNGWLPSPKVRLFPRDDRIRFHNVVHEIVEPSLAKAGYKIKPCNIPIHHYGKLNEEKTRAKSEAYYLMGKKKLNEATDNPDALRELAVQAGELGKFEEALELYQRYVRFKPDDHVTYYNMAVCYLETGKFHESRGMAQKALQLAPDCKEALLDYGSASLCTGDIEDAISTLEGLLRNVPDYPPAETALAAGYFILERREAGLEVLKKLRMRGFNSSLALHSLAKKFMAGGRAEHAIRVLLGMLESGHIHEDTMSLLEECEEKRSGS